MRPSERIEKIVKGMSFKAGKEMDGRLWADALQATTRVEKTRAALGPRRIWETVMKRKAVQLTAAAMLLVAALAVGVETLRLNKLDKAYAFSTRIRANMALDLDPKGALPLAQPRPEDFDVTWDSEGGGALKTMAGSTVRILACPYIRPDWDGAVSWAYTNIEKLKESTAVRVIPTEQNPFVAVLTSEGNLAVVKIGGGTEVGAWLSWRVDKSTVPQYGPVQTVTLHFADKEDTAPQECAIDLDTGRLIAIPLQVWKSSDGLLAWLEQSGVDAIASRTDGGYGLNGVGLIFWAWGPAAWAGTSAVGLRGQMASASDQSRTPIVFKEGQYQSGCAFKTREGGIGMLQLLAVDASRSTVQFRYRLVQEDLAGVAATAAAEDTSSEQRLAESLHRIRQFGLIAFMYAEKHDGQYASSLEVLKEYAEKMEQDYQWIADNVGYVGAGKTARDPGSTLIAYDKALLAAGKGTHAVFRDGHAEFLTPDEVRERGLGSGSSGNPATTPKPLHD